MSDIVSRYQEFKLPGEHLKWEVILFDPVWITRDMYTHVLAKMNFNFT